MKLFFTLFALGLCLQALAQYVLTGGDRWTDVALYKSLKQGNEASANTNYSNSSTIISNTWTESGSLAQHRSLLRFTLNAIAPGTIIISVLATFY